MIPPFITKIFAGKAKEVVGKILEGADNLFTSKEEKAAFELKAEQELNRSLESMRSDILKEYELEIQDRSNARAREAEFVKSTGHIDYMQMTIGILVMACFIVTVWFVATQPLPEGSEHLLINAMGILEGMVLAVVGYYYGSSAGSRIKDMKK